MKITPESLPVGSRAIVRERSYMRGVTEILVVEWSPMGTAVKVRYPNGAESWSLELPEYGVIHEALPPVQISPLIPINL